jgi:hypothetical protein
VSRHDNVVAGTKVMEVARSTGNITLTSTGDNVFTIIADSGDSASTNNPLITLSQAGGDELMNIGMLDDGEAWVSALNGTLNLKGEGDAFITVETDDVVLANAGLQVQGPMRSVCAIYSAEIAWNTAVPATTATTWNVVPLNTKRDIYNPSSVHCSALSSNQFNLSEGWWLVEGWVNSFDSWGSKCQVWNNTNSAEACGGGSAFTHHSTCNVTVQSTICGTFFVDDDTDDYELRLWVGVAHGYDIVFNSSSMGTHQFALIKLTKIGDETS